MEFKVNRLLPLSYAPLTCAQISGASNHLYGDGMAIWFTTDRTQPGPVFGNKGPSARI